MSSPIEKRMSVALFGISTARHSRLCRWLMTICYQLERDKEIRQSHAVRVKSQMGTFLIALPMHRRIL